MSSHDLIPEEVEQGKHSLNDNDERASCLQTILHALKQRKYTKWLILLIGVTAIAIAIGLGLYFGAIQPSHPSDTTSSKAATVSPSATSSPAAPAPPISTEDQIRFEIQRRSPSTSFHESMSPQSRALAWLLSDAYTTSQYLKASNSTDGTTNTDRLLQRFALATLWYSTNGTNWDHTGWVESTDECDWGGGDEEDFIDDADVACDANRRVVGLFLCCDSLSGQIPIEIGLLTSLTSLDLASNQLTGTIVTELGQLTQLRRMVLDNNKLTGAIPSAMSLSLPLLEFLYLDNNQLTGTIPTQLSQLTSIQTLYIKNNQFTGTIPTHLAQLSKTITWLTLHKNRLVGSIPTDLGALTRLTQLSLFDNALTGPLPSELGQLSNLVYLSLTDNRLEGAIPVELGQLSVAAIFLYNNALLSGTIPNALCGSSSGTTVKARSIDCNAIKCECCTDLNGEDCVT